MATLASIRAELLRVGDFGTDAITATGGSTTTVVVDDDARIVGQLGDNQLLNNWILPLTGNEAGNVRRVSDHDEDTGTLTIPNTPAWGTGMASTETFELWGKIHPSQAQQCIERALRRMRYETIWPMSMIEDGDMETDGIGNWTATNATVAKDTDAADVIHGAQSLSVITTTAGGYAQSDNVKVEGGVSYNLFVDARVAAGTATVWVVDITNSNTVLVTDTWAEGDWGVINVSFLTADSTDNIAVRLGIAENTTTAHFDNAQLIRPGRQLYDLPDWFDNGENEVIKVLDFRGNRPRFRTPVNRGIEVAVLHNPTGAHKNQVLFPQGVTGQPWVQSIRTFLSEEATLSTDATVVASNMEWTIANAMMQVLYFIQNRRGSDNVEDWDRLWNRWVSKARAQNKKHQPKAASSSPKVQFFNWRT